MSKKIPFKISPASRAGGSNDLVTTMRQQESNPYARRGAMKDGAERFNYRERSGHAPEGTAAKRLLTGIHTGRVGSMDSIASSAGMELDFDYASHQAWIDSFKSPNPIALEKYLAQNYQVHEDTTDIRHRVFIFSMDVAAYVLAVPDTLKFCGVDAEQPIFSEYEAMLQGEMELADNPRTLRNAVRVNLVTEYIWKVRTLLGGDQ
jgi:hypothetical protein